MIGTLLKRQLAEVWRSYFFDSKTGRARSKASTAIRFALFALIIAGILGWAFTALAVSLCKPLTSVGMNWLYFAVMGLTAMLLGAFGAVFNSFSSLYLAKDNDLLLSLPIPVSAILASRLANVYLLGLMYAAPVLVPTMVVYWVTVELSAVTVLATLIWSLLITLLVLVVSCLFGWIVARINQKTKNKSFVAVIASVLFLAAYWVVYFNLQELFSDLSANAAAYGEAVYESASVLYFFGSAAQGDWLALFGMAAVCMASLALTWVALSRSFLHIATGTGVQKKAAYREKAVKSASPAIALLRKELGRFTSSANYMLNCGLGILLLLVLGVALLWQGGELVAVFDEAFAGIPSAAAILICTIICLLEAMNDMAAPSVSLEGKNLWLTRSLPVSTWQILQAKANLQYALTAVPAFICSLCAIAALHLSLIEALVVLLVPQAFAILHAFLSLAFGILWPNLTWTDETAPVKRSMAVFLAMVAGWVLGCAFAVLYLWQGWQMGPASYLIATIAISLAISLALRIWLVGRGCAQFEAL